MVVTTFLLSVWGRYLCGGIRRHIIELLKNEKGRDPKRQESMGRWRTDFWRSQNRMRMVLPTGFEPVTLGFRDRSSAAELKAAHGIRERDR